MKAGALAYVTTRDSDDVMASAINEASVSNRIISPRLSSRMAARLASGSIEMDSGRISVLSQRELDVYRMLGSGNNVKEIALSLAMAAKTVETYQRRIKEKLGLKSAAELRSSAIAFAKSE
jgi:DNA-binding NarL/FixJ family response regulator